MDTLDTCIIQQLDMFKILDLSCSKEGRDGVQLGRSVSGKRGGVGEGEEDRLEDS